MSVVTKSGTGRFAAGGVIGCAWHLGCGAQFHGSNYTNTLGTRQEARAEGWLVGQQGGRWADSSGRTIRLDYCPEHAGAERERRGLRPAPGSAERCLECGGLDGAHGRVHTRYGNGGGGNRPCSRAQESGDPS